MATTFAATPTFSSLALAGFFHGSASATDAVQADISYILTGPGQPGLAKASATPNMQSHINPFTCILAGSSPGSSGPQLWTSGTSQIDITHDPADLTNPRIDLVSVQITQNPDPAQTPPLQGMAKIVVTTGTPASSPVAPTSPAGSLDLSTVFIASGAGATITNSSFSPKQSLGGLRGAVVRGYTGAFGRVTRPGQPYYDETTGRLYLSQMDGSLEGVPGVGSTWPEWFLRGIPGGFLIPNNSTTAPMGYSTNDKLAGVSVTAQTTGAIINFLETGSYQVRVSGTIAANGSGTHRRASIVHRNSSGGQIRRIQNGPTNGAPNAVFGPRLSVSGRIRVTNVGEQCIANMLQDSGGSLGPSDADGDWVFEGYKVMDI